MPALTRFTGGGLVLLGVVAFVATGADSPTALIPAALGAVLVVLGFVADRENLHRHAMHAAMLVALLGVLGTAMNLGEVPDLIAGDAERPVAVIASLVTAVLLVVYLVLGIRSFVRARRSPG